MRVIGLLLLLLCCQPLLAAECLRVGFFALQPHVRPAAPGETEAQGPAVDFLRQLGQSMDTPICIARQPLPLARLLRYLQEGELDVALAVARTPERERLLHYPNVPFMQLQPSLVVARTVPWSRVDGSLLPGLHIGIWSDGYLSPLMQTKGLNLMPLSGEQVVERGVALVIRDQLDAFYSPDEYHLRHVIGALGAEHQVRIIPLVESATGLYTAFSRTSVNAAQVERYEQALARSQLYSDYLRDHLARD